MTGICRRIQEAADPCHTTLRRPPRGPVSYTGVSTEGTRARMEATETDRYRVGRQQMGGHNASYDFGVGEGHGLLSAPSKTTFGGLRKWDSSGQRQFLSL